MEYEGQECGILVQVSRRVRFYSPIRVDKFVESLTTVPKENAIEKCEMIRDYAARQAGIFPEEDDTHGKIKNTAQFAEQVLNALRGN